MDAVLSERVSAPKFPANREINREIRANWRNYGLFGLLLCSEFRGLRSKFPKLRNREFFHAKRVEVPSEQGRRRGETPCQSASQADLPLWLAPVAGAAPLPRGPGILYEPRPHGAGGAGLSTAKRSTTFAEKARLQNAM